MAVNSSPVVGENVSDVVEVAKCSVSGVSVEAQDNPVSPMQFTRTAGVPGRTVPVVEAPAGFKNVLSAKSVMSKPFSPPEPLTTTATRT